MAKPEKLSTGEKALLITVSIFAVLLLGILYWHYTLESNPVISVPTPVLPQANAQEYYVKASDMIGDLKVGTWRYKYGIDDLEAFYRPEAKLQTSANLLTTTSQPAPTWETAEAFAQKSAPAFAILHHGFIINYHAIPIRSIAHGQKKTNFKFGKTALALALAGRVNAHHGDWVGATNYALDAVQLGEEVQHGGGIFACIIGRESQAIGRAIARKALPHLSDARARVAARRMETLIARTQPYAQILQEQKYSTLAWMNECFHKPGWRSEIFGEHAEIFNYTISKRNVTRHFIHAMDLAIANTKQPYVARNEPLFNEGYLLNQIGVLKTIGTLHGYVLISDTANAFLLISYALQAYNAEHGNYPSKLSDLTPVYLKTIPNDPFAPTKPLGYKRVGMHYLLYSIGPDGFDDGGKAISNEELNAPHGDMGMGIRPVIRGDIVAGVSVQ